MLAQTSPRPKVPPLPPLLPAEQAWLVTLDARPSAGAAMDDARVYIPIGQRGEPGGPPEDAGPPAIVALDRETGEQHWLREVASTWPPVPSGPLLLVVVGDGVRALDALTGEDRWNAALAQPAIAPPAVSAGLLIVPVQPDELIALHVQDGSLAWRRSLGGSSGPTSMRVDGQSVYVALADSRVVCVSVRDGHVVWTRTLTGKLSAPAVGRDRVFVGSTDNVVFALDAESGAVRWAYPTGGDVVGAAALEDTVFVVSLDNVLRALNRGNGNQRWKRALTTRPSAPPDAFGGLVVVYGLSPAVAAFAARDGTPNSMYEGASELVGPALVDRRLQPFRVSIVAVAGDGRVAGLRPIGMMFREPPASALTGLPGAALQREASPLASPAPAPQSR